MASGSHARAEPPVSDRIAFRGGLLVSNAVTPSWDQGPEAGILVGLEWSHFGEFLYGGLDASLGGVPFRGAGPFLGGHVGWHTTRGERLRFLAAAAGGLLEDAQDLGRERFDFRDSYYDMGGNTLSGGVTLSLMWRPDRPDPPPAPPR